ncbi:MAG: di-heme oxidoredictase family protein [Sulfurimonas sp.]|nr:di-heme oxidoredictase family protein [Sulfurimonas sp.]
MTDAQILKNQDIKDLNKDGISGKANIVYSHLHKDFRVGRFTYKASSPSILHQTASAASTDMSLTSVLFPNENCTKKQKECLESPKGDTFDIPIKRLEAISFYLQNLEIPPSIITQKRGEALFLKIGCVKCHRPFFELDDGSKVRAFSDILLHDVGEGLSDGRSEFRATPREWRTAPLWGIAKYIRASNNKAELLHDGRAKSIEEAILWHGGEAQEIKNTFMNLSARQREDIIQYIKEL